MENKAINTPNKKTVQALPTVADAMGTGMNSLVLQLAKFKDNIPEWGTDLKKRDAELAKFWKTEDFLASTINSIAMTRSSLSWKLVGTPRLVDYTQTILKRSDFNRGWQSLISKVVVDLLTQDNGSFLEVVRGKPQQGRKPESAPVLAINHLPASNCIRTGDPITPVIFIDADGKYHKLKWYECVALSEVPIPSEDNKNIQFCFVSRVLKYAQSMKAVNNYRHEKVSGRFGNAIHIASGVSNLDLERIQEKSQLDANNMGLVNYMAPIILSTIDPSATVSLETIELASLAENFDYADFLHSYILLLSLGAGVSYTDLSPLTGGSLGSSEQTSSLAEKARVKSLLLFMKMIESALVNSRVIPPSVSFKFTNSDGDVEEREAETKLTRAKTRKLMIEDGTITVDVARRIAVDDNDLQQVYLAAMGSQQLLTVTVSDAERVSEKLTPIDVEVETPTVVEPVTIDVADSAAKWLTKMVRYNPINVGLPIPESQLETFEVALRNKLKETSIIGTDDVWMDHKTIEACYEAGIEPNMLRYRLPDNYNMVITKDIVKDTKGQIIYVKEYVKDITPKIEDFLEDITVDNFMEKLDAVLTLTNSTVSKEYVQELNRLKYFNDIELLKLKLVGTYYKNLTK